jgi:carbonic anhydrase
MSTSSSRYRFGAGSFDNWRQQSLRNVGDSPKYRRWVCEIIQIDPRDLGLLAGQKARDRAAILGCSDARVPIELIFNEGSNDLFVVRVAVNGLAARWLAA